MIGGVAPDGADLRSTAPRDAVVPATRRGRLVTAVVLLVSAVAFAIFGTATPEARLSWSTGTAPQRILNAPSLVATTGGFAVLAGPEFSGGMLWESPDGVEWTGSPLPKLASRVVENAGELLVVDGRSLSRLDSSGGLVTVDAPGIVRLGNGSDRTGVIVAAGGILLQTLIGDLYWSSDTELFELAVPAPTWRSDADTIQRPFDFDGSDRRFRSNCDAVARRAPDIPPMASTPDGIVALIPTTESAAVWPTCEPIPWISEDGLTWAPTGDETPFTFGAYVFDVAWRDGRFIAVGGVGFDNPAAWTSADGITWEDLDIPEVEDPLDLAGIEAGELGWVMSAVPRSGQDPISWFSHNGECWEPLPEGVHGEAVAIGADRIMLIDATPSATVWIGTLDDSFAAARICL